jgi:hypothetical protein
MPVEGRDDEVVAVTFIQRTASYNVGETAYFLPEAAQALIDEGVAVATSSLAPINQEVPAVVQAGNVLSCTMGVWLFDPDTYAYRWQFDGADVGVDSPEYLTNADDVGKTATCTVTATNEAGSTTAPPSVGVVITEDASV